VPPSGGSPDWGSVTGTLSNQTDLQAALDAKATSSHAHAAADVSSGVLADDRVDGSLEADELVLAGDVDGTANANDLDEAAVEAELESVLDLPDLQGQITDGQIAAGAVDGGNLGEIADGSVTADDLGTDSVSADELNATGVEAELEAVLDLSDLQGAVTDGQIPAAIARDSETAAAVTAHEALSDPHTGYQRESEKNAASGYAGLDGSSKLAGTQQVYGSTADTAAQGNDARLSDARTPTAHASTHQPGGGDAMAVDAAAGVGSLRTLGTGAAQATAGNDARLSDSRVPNGSASGDLGGSYPSPTVTQARGLRETAGPTTLTLAAVADGEYLRRVGSTVVGAAGGGGYATVQEEGSSLTQRAILNFIGSSITCVDDGSTKTNCTITGGGGGLSHPEVMTRLAVGGGY
jgi:hypothetical protein